MAAGCTSFERAEEARLITVRRGIAHGAFRAQRAPWERHEPAPLRPPARRVERRRQPVV